MKLKQISVPLENSSVRLYETNQILQNNGIQILGFNLVDNGLLGEIRLIVSDVIKARQALMQHYTTAFLEDVLAVNITGNNNAHQMSALLSKIMNAGLIIKYAYALSNIKTAEKTIIIFNFNDNDKAYEIIKAANMQTMILEKLGERKAA